MAEHFDYKKHSYRRIIFILLGLLICAVSFMTDVIVGPASLTPYDVCLAVLQSPEASKSANVIVWSIRLPTAVMALLVGASLGIAGAGMQTILDNPLPAGRLSLYLSHNFTHHISIDKDAVCLCPHGVMPDNGLDLQLPEAIQQESQSGVAGSLDRQSLHRHAPLCIATQQGAQQGGVRRYGDGHEPLHEDRIHVRLPCGLRVFER